MKAVDEEYARAHLWPRQMFHHESNEAATISNERRIYIFNSSVA